VSAETGGEKEILRIVPLSRSANHVRKGRKDREDRFNEISGSFKGFVYIQHREYHGTSSRKTEKKCVIERGRKRELMKR